MTKSAVKTSEKIARTINDIIIEKIIGDLRGKLYPKFVFLVLFTAIVFQ